MKSTQMAWCCMALVACAGPAVFPPAADRGAIPIHRNREKPSAQVFQYETAPPAALAQLFTPAQAQAIIEQFKGAYVRLGAPRMDVRVNLPPGAATALPGVIGPSIDPNTGLPAQAPAAVPATTPANVAASPAGTPAALPRNADTGPLADRQTRRDVERLFGRPLRQAGVKLVDPDLVNPPEVTLEVLISERAMTIRGIGGDQSLAVPDVQVTAVRVADGRILGQATVLDLFPKAGQAAAGLRRFDVRALAEATALALMKDMARTPVP